MTRDAGWGEDGRRLVRSPFLLLLLAGKATFQHIFSLPSTCLLDLANLQHSPESPFLCPPTQIYAAPTWPMASPQELPSTAR